MNTKRIGNISEAKALAKFLEKGWVVLQPFGDAEPYDLVIDRGQGFERVQVKTGRYHKGCCIFNAHSISGRTNNQTETKYIGLADLFAVYYPPLDVIYLLDVNDIGHLSIPMLRLEPTKNNQQYRTRYAKDYVL